MAIVQDAERLNRFQHLLAGRSHVDGLLIDRTADFDVSSLHGPLYGKPADSGERDRVLKELRRHSRLGTQHYLWLQYQQEAAALDPELAGDVMGINIAVPRIIQTDAASPELRYVVLISNKADASRIARRHVKKQPNLTPLFFNSVISTTDNQAWRQQRQYLTPVFLPRTSLSKIFPTSLRRAQHCAARLLELALEAGPYGVQMHEFYLHEAQAQLQLALFGMSDEFMESSNQRIRDAFSGIETDPSYAKNMCLTMLQKVGENSAFATASDPEVCSGKKPVFGPLSKAVSDAASELEMNLDDQFGNMMLILFAGHDTTAHTMTWFTYELARNPELQTRLQAEVDAMFDSLGGRSMTYEDCVKLPFMTKCIVETLRLWMPVPNGTFRELETDEQIVGPGGKPTTLPAGTYIQVVNFTRHRNPILWGTDATVFNPDREFKDSEIWGGRSFHATNPESERFSPFTHAPRECLGKNFAQMEMRTILSHLFHAFTFELSEPYAQHDPARDGPLEVASGTMGPRDLTPDGLVMSERRRQSGQLPKMGMHLKAVPRRSGTASRL